MAIAKHLRQPKLGGQPETRQVKLGADPESLETQTIAWHFHRLDWNHEKWGWQLKAPIWKQILLKLISFEGLTWAILKEQAGGRKRGTNHHSLKISDLTKAARDRITQLRLDQYDKIFSLRVSGTVRIYGIRDGRVMRLLWYDKCHGTKDEVCPTGE
jgi:hypothetical protein